MEIISKKLEKVLEAEGGGTLLRMEYPQFEADMSSSGIKRINGYYRRCASALLSFCIKRRPADAERYECTAYFTVPLCSDSAVSVFREVYERIDGVRYPAAGYSETWDAAHGTPVSFKSASGGEKLSSLLRRAVPAAGTYIPVRFTDAAILKKHFSKDRFYLSPEGLHIFFQPGTLAPCENGIAVFCIGQTQPSGR